EVTSELVRFSLGTQTYGKLFALLAVGVYGISLLNFIIAIRMYRRKPILECILHSFAVSTYVYAHWVPVIIISFLRIIAGKQASTWHPTEHGINASTTST
ncbi:MAG: hypothetical protein ACRD3W_06210, partial [Terriglobales bacterium]